MVMDKITKGIMTLGLVGLVAGCAKPIPKPSKELHLSGYVENHYNTKLSHDDQPNLIGLNIRLDCIGDKLSCRELDMNYHGDKGDYKTIPVTLGTGKSTPNLNKGEAVEFILTDGFLESGKQIYWVNGTPAIGKLLEYFPLEE